MIQIRVQSLSLSLSINSSKKLMLHPLDVTMQDSWRQHTNTPTFHLLTLQCVKDKTHCIAAVYALLSSRLVYVRLGLGWVSGPVWEPKPVSFYTNPLVVISRCLERAHVVLAEQHHGCADDGAEVARVRLLTSLWNTLNYKHIQFQIKNPLLLQ